MQNTKIKPGYKKTDIGVVPEDWEVSSIGNLCNYQNGKSLEHFFNKNNGYKVISIGNYSPEGRYINNNSYISSSISEVKSFILNKGELTMILNDKTSIGTIIGRVLLIDKNNEYVFNQRTMRLKTYEEINSGFLFYKINGPEVHKRIVRLAKPGTQIYINTNDVLDFNISYPICLTEQKKIAQSLSDTDDLITSLDELISKKEKIKEGTMQELLTGKRRLPGFSLEWKEKGLGDITSSLSSGASNTYSENGEYILYGSTGKIGTKKYFDYRGESILVARVGANAGTLYIVKGKYCVSDNTLILKYKPEHNIKFGLYKLKLFNLNKLVFGSGQPLITGGQLKNIQLLYPPSVNEENSIANLLFDMDNELEQLKEKRNKYKQVKEGMMQELLTGRIRLV